MLRRTLPVAIALSLTACHAHSAELSADHAWVRLPAVSGRPGVAYLTIHGGKADATLVSVATPAAMRAELHESMETPGKGKMPGMMTMKPIANVAVPAGSEVTFEPGGKHVMLFDMDPQLRAGDTTEVDLNFASGKTLQVSAKVVGAGQSAPTSFAKQ